MNIKVNSHTLEINQNIDINAGEYNITTLNFEFSDEYEGLTKMAVFSNCETSIKTAILNNQCTIPFEVLEEPGQVLLGVYGYEGEDDSLELRYSPEPQYFNVKHGSYQEGGEPTIPPKTEWEQLVEEINQAITETNNLNISATKENHTTTITITKKDGTTYQVQILDGEKGEKGDKGDPGAIKMIIVNELPTTGQDDTIYLVPNTDPETQNNYDEYVYVNGQWEKLGGVQVEVDLTDYVKNTDYATSSTGGVFKTSAYDYGLDVLNGFLLPNSIPYSTYETKGNNYAISKGTLENVITGKDLTTKSYVDGLVGDIESILTTLDIGGGV